MQGIPDSAEAIEAAWRTAASQLLKTTREPLVALLSRHLGPDDPALRGRIAAFLETDIGTALLGSLLSVGLANLPGAVAPQAGRLAKELRVKAMTDMGDLTADLLMGPLRQVVSLYIHGGVPVPEMAQLPGPSSEAALPGPGLTETRIVDASHPLNNQK